MTESENALREKIRAQLPPELFAPQPMWCLLVIPVVALIAAASVMLARFSPPWHLGIPCSILIGFMYGSLTFLGHDIAHGASVRPGRLRNLVTYVCFAIYCVSPHLWQFWHNRAHHGQSNVEGRDPDNFGTLQEFKRDGWWSRLMVRFAPGSGYCASALYLCLFFTIQGQSVLLSKSKRLPDFSSMRRRRAIIDTLALAGFWVGVGVLAGPRGAVLVVVLPMLVSNFVVMSYIVTNHMLCPMAPSRDTLNTTLSVTTHKILDIAHFHFSHHLEHHLFPAMCSRYYPLVRRRLRDNLGERYLAPSHWRALLDVARTPRVYDRLQVLVDPFSGRRVETATVLAKLRRSAGSEVDGGGCSF